MQKIIRITCEYNAYKEEDIYINLDENETLLDFEVDSVNKKLIVFAKKKQLGVGDFSIKFVDMKTKKFQEYHFKKEGALELYGRFYCGLYEFQGGHIYYNNNVIKVRWDIIESSSALTYSLDDVLDKYSDVLPIPDHKAIAIGFPFDSKYMNKLAYVIRSCSSCNNDSSSKLLIMPYLHDRKIYNNHREKNTRYFMTQLPEQDKPTQLASQIKPTDKHPAQDKAGDNLEGHEPTEEDNSIMRINITDSIFQVFF